MVYSLAVVQPRARRFLGDPERYERFALELAAGQRWKVLAVAAVLGLSGAGLIAVDAADGGRSGLWWTVVGLKLALLAGAVALFVYVSWRLWPARLFADADRLPELQRRFNRVALALTVTIGLGLVLGAVADSFA